MKTIFRNVTVPGSVARHQDRVDVVLDGANVEAIVPAGRAPARADDVVDASSSYLVAGLVDGHVHFPDFAEPVFERLAIEYLMHGITGVFCMHGSDAVLRLRDRIADGGCLGPRITTTGPMQDDPAMTLDQGRAVVREHVVAGYDAIKVYSRLSPDGFAGIMAGAQSANLPVVGHVVRSVGLRETLRPPQQQIAHLEEFVYALLDVSVETLADDKPIEYDSAALDEIAMELIERGISVGTTIEAIRSAYEQVRDADAWFAQPDLAALPQQLRDDWLPPNNFYSKNFDSAAHANGFRRIVDLVKRLAVEFHRRGVRLIAGTDALHSGVAHGTSLYRELRDLVGAGLSDGDAFRACVSAPLSQGQARPGDIDVGYSGDLLLLGGNPYDDVAHVRDVRGVLVDGRYVTRRELTIARAAMRDSVAG